MANLARIIDKKSCYDCAFKIRDRTGTYCEEAHRLICDSFGDGDSTACEKFREKPRREPVDCIPIENIFDMEDL